MAQALLDRGYDLVSGILYVVAAWPNNIFQNASLQRQTVITHLFHVFFSSWDILIKGSMLSAILDHNFISLPDVTG